MKQCPKCYSLNQDFDTVCNNCGSSLNLTGEPVAYGINPHNEDNPPMPPKTNGMAIASLVLGAVSIPLAFFCVGFITSILAIIFGFIALSKIKSSAGREHGKGMALAGIIMAFLGLAIMIAYIIYIVNSDQFARLMDEYRNQINNSSRNKSF